MAINITDYSVNSELRDSLGSNITDKANEFSSSVGGAQLGLDPMFSGALGVLVSNGISGRVGITADMVSQIQTAYDNYISQINSDIAQIENPEVNQAFKGSSVETAFKNLVSSVKETAQRFTQSLKEAEMQIIQEVQKAYETQDTSIAGDINSDAGTLR